MYMHIDSELFFRIFSGDYGEAVLTSHRLFWGRPGVIQAGGTCMGLQLKHVAGINEEWASSNLFGKKKRLIIRFLPLESVSKQSPGPRDSSKHNFIKLSTKDGIREEFITSINETVSAKLWNIVQGDRIKLRSGIVGIERSLHEKHKQTDDSISIAFQDLTKLMAMAQDMTNVSKGISAKIKDRQGDISDDETVKFKVIVMNVR